MGKAEKAYKSVEALRKKHPHESTIMLCKRARTDLNNYYRGRAKVIPPKTRGSRKARMAAAVAQMPTARADGDGLVRVLIGTPSQIREVLS